MFFIQSIVVKLYVFVNNFMLVILDLQKSKFVKA